MGASGASNGSARNGAVNEVVIVPNSLGVVDGQVDHPDSVLGDRNELVDDREEELLL